MTKCLIILLLVGLFSYDCFSQYECKELIRILMITEITDSSDIELLTTIDLDLEFDKIGKEAIPYLINAISDKRTTFTPCSSNKSSIIQSNYVGTFAAYQIEKILGDTSTCTTIQNRETPNYKKGSNIIMCLHYKDMKEIKKIYKRWWKLNRKKTLEELKVDWEKYGSPLRTSKYVWEMVLF